VKDRATGELEWIDRVSAVASEIEAEVITHGPRGNIVDIYTSLPWPLLCEEVAKLRVQLLAGQVIQLPPREPEVRNKKAWKALTFQALVCCGVDGTRTRGLRRDRPAL
jgi:hypothetical protein